MSGGTPQIIRPTSTAEAAAFIAENNVRGRRLALRGGATRRALPNDVDAVLCSTALDAVLDYAPQNLVIEVEAGITLEALDATLAAHGQRLPLDAASQPGATLGGLLSTNSIGPRRHRFGTARDWVIGSKLIRPDGALVASGGRVVKNVSGYDLTKLYIGSHGRFGLLASVTLKLEPLPAGEEWLVARAVQLDAAIQIQRDLERAPLPLVAVAGGREPEGAGWCVQFGFEGWPELLSAQLDVALALARVRCPEADWQRVAGAFRPQAIERCGSLAPPAVPPRREGDDAHAELSAALIAALDPHGLFAESAR